MGRDRFAETEGTRGDEYRSSPTWEERNNDSTCVRVDPNGSVVLAWVVDSAFARVVAQSVVPASAQVFTSVTDEPQFTVHRLEGSAFSFSHHSLVRSHPHQLLKIHVLYFTIHTTCYPSQFRFPHLCSRSDCFRGPGLIYVSILHGLCLGHSGFLRSQNRYSRRFSRTQNSMAYEALAHTSFQSLNGTTSAAHP